MPASSRSRPGSSARPRRVWKRPSQRRPPGPLRAEALLFLARVRYHSHDARSALALAEQALEEVGDDEELKPHIQLELAAAAEAVGDRARARAHAREAVALAEAEGDDAILAEALALVGFHDFLAGEPDARSTMSRALELEGAAASIRPLRSPTFRRAGVAMWMDELDAARSTFVELAKRCREGGDEGSLAVILFMLAEVECSAGNWSEGGAYADESCEITAWTGHLPYRSLALSAKALIDAHLGRAEAARATAEEGLELAQRSGLVQASQFNLAALGFLELSLDNPKETNELLWPLAEGVLASGVTRARRASVPAGRDRGAHRDRRGGHGAFDSSSRSPAQAETLNRSWALATSERGWGLLHASIGNLPECARGVRPGPRAPLDARRAVRARSDAPRTGSSVPAREEVAAREGIARSVAGDLRAARRGSVGRQSHDRDGQDRRTVSRPGRPDADRAGGRRAGGAADSRTERSPTPCS